MLETAWAFLCLLLAQRPQLAAMEELNMKSKWLVWWRDGSVTVWDAAQWSAAQLVAMGNVIDAELVPAAMARSARSWWQEDAR